MESELEISDKDSYIIEESSSEYESESDSMNETEDSESDTEINDLNNSNSSYNVAVQPVDQASDMSVFDINTQYEVMEEEKGHFEADFDDTCGTKYINRCNEPIFFHIFCTHNTYGIS